MRKALNIGKREIGSRVLVAPMSGVTDLPFRRVLQQFEPGYVVSEMVAGKELAEGNADTELRAAGKGDIDPLVIQLVGNERQWMREGAASAEALGADIIDINMGCPARKVTSGLSGSALMRDLDHAMTLVEAVLSGTSKPVTLKMRLGWDHDNLNAAELARRAEAAGVVAIIVHGRTRQQFYEGQADWTAIRDVSEAVDLPVIVNGDIDSGEAAQKALEASGADAVMVGRALTGQPWLLADIKAALGEPPSQSRDALSLVTSHYDDIISLYGEKRGARVARKHVQAYLEKAGCERETISAALRENDPACVRDMLIAVFDAREAA